MIEDNERWLSDGDCMHCRRAPYCKKVCTAQKQRKREKVRQMIREKTGAGKILEALGDAANGESI